MLIAPSHAGRCRSESLRDSPGKTLGMARRANTAYCTRQFSALVLRGRGSSRYGRVAARARALNGREPGVWSTHEHFRWRCDRRFHDPHAMLLHAVYRWTRGGAMLTFTSLAWCGSGGCGPGSGSGHWSRCGGDGEQLRPRRPPGSESASGLPDGGPSESGGEL